MSNGYQHILGIQRLTCLGGVVFAVVIMFQHFEFPYGDVISSLFSVSKNHITKTESYTPVPQILGDIAGVANSTTPADLVVKGIMSTDKGEDEGTTKDDISERKKELDDSKILNRNGVSGNPVMYKIKQNNSMAPEKEIESGSGFSMDNATSSTVSLANVSSLIKVPNKKQKRNVVSISEMLDILAHNRASSHSMKPRWSSRADQELLEAKLQIENAPLDEDDHNLHPSVFRNVSIFRRSYELMEKTLKVYIYKEGEKPIFNQPEAVMKGIYASEGWFMMQMKESKRFVTRKPKEAHLFYIPYSSKKLRETLSPYSHDRQSLVPYLKSYLDMISGRYSFWNRTGGADHFLVACHDWGAEETREFMGTCIRALCNTDVEKEGFELGKDVSLPTTNVRDPHNPLRERGGKPPSKRSILAFFAGKMHGSFRPILLRFWGNKDPDMKIFEKLPQVKDDRNYVDYMKSSKFCICAKGSGVNSPRVVEAIFYECVPVIISDNFVPPFFEFLDWESFAVFIRQKDIPNLKTILLSIPNKRYLQMHQRVKQVQQHFLWHVKPVRYDIFHMILHSIWYNRVLRVNSR